MKNILITGAAGYIGSHICELLIKKKKKIICIDNLSTGFKELLLPGSIFIKADIRNSKKILKILKEYNIDSVIHLAAKLNIDESQKRKKEYFSNNVYATLQLINLCNEAKVKNFLFSSTCAVYGNHSKGYVYENDKKKPTSYYGKTKLLAENLINNKFKGNKFILRYFNVVGSSKSGKIGQISDNGQLFKNLSKEILKEKPSINVFGNNYENKDGTCIRDYIHVSDLAKIHIKVLSKMNSKNISGVLNCGYGKGYSVLEIIKAFENVSKKKIRIKLCKKRDGDISKIICKSKTIKKIINLKFDYKELRDIIKTSIQWEKKLKKIKKFL